MFFDLWYQRRKEVEQVNLEYLDVVIKQYQQTVATFSPEERLRSPAKLFSTILQDAQELKDDYNHYRFIDVDRRASGKKTHLTNALYRYVVAEYPFFPVENTAESLRIFFAKNPNTPTESCDETVLAFCNSSGLYFDPNKKSWYTEDWAGDAVYFCDATEESICLDQLAKERKLQLSFATEEIWEKLEPFFPTKPKPRNWRSLEDQLKQLAQQYSRIAHPLALLNIDVPFEETRGFLLYLRWFQHALQKQFNFHNIEGIAYNPQTKTTRALQKDQMNKLNLAHEYYFLQANSPSLFALLDDTPSEAKQLISQGTYILLLPWEAASEILSSQSGLATGQSFDFNFIAVATTEPHSGGKILSKQDLGVTLTHEAVHFYLSHWEIPRLINEAMAFDLSARNSTVSPRQKKYQKHAERAFFLMNDAFGSSFFDVYPTETITPDLFRIALLSAKLLSSGLQALANVDLKELTNNRNIRKEFRTSLSQVMTTF